MLLVQLVKVVLAIAHISKNPKPKVHFSFHANAYAQRLVYQRNQFGSAQTQVVNTCN